mgnify:CR=1 FL=1
MNNILITIAARGGSKGIPSKNLIEINGESLVERSINLAKNSNLSKYITVSTDSDEIMKIAKKNESSCWFKRPSKLSGDNVPKTEVITHALIKSESYFNKKFDTVIDIDVTAPLTTVDDILGALQLYKDKNYEFVTTGCESRKNPYFNMVKIGTNKLKLVNESDYQIPSRQKAPKIYDLNGAIYIYDRNFLIEKKKMFSENQGLYIMPQERSCDIDTIEDLEYAKFKLSENQERKIVVIGGNGLIGSSVVNNLNNIYTVFNVDIKNKHVYKLKNNIHNYFGDALNIESIKKVFKDIEKNYGQIDTVINCTHFKRKTWGKDHSKIKKEEFNESMDQLLTSVFLISQLSINHFLNNGGGNLVNLASIQGTQPPKFWHYEGTDMSSPIEYSLAKSSIISMTTYLAKYYKNKNIRINCISPGGIKDNQPESFLNNYRSSTSNIGMLEPSDVSNAIEWLISEKSRAVNGQNIVVDDGWSL